MWWKPVGFVAGLLLIHTTVQAQNFGTVTCNEYYDSNKPTVTLSFSGTTTVTGNCTVSGGSITTYTLVLSSPEAQTTCEVTLSAPSTVGNHQLSAQLYYATSSSGPWYPATNNTFTFSAIKTTTRRYFRVGGTLTIGRFSEGRSSASGSLNARVTAGSGSCYFGVL